MITSDHSDYNLGKNQDKSESTARNRRRQRTEEKISSNKRHCFSLNMHKMSIAFYYFKQ